MLALSTKSWELHDRPQAERGVCPHVDLVRDEANDESAICLKRGNDLIESAVGKERPWFGRVAPGDWDLRVTFANFPQYTNVEIVNAPVHEVEVPV